jgi:hypothetical protein
VIGVCEIDVVAVREEGFVKPCICPRIGFAVFGGTRSADILTGQYDTQRIHNGKTGRCSDPQKLDRS